MIVAKGTGINVYNVIQQQMNTSFAVDGGPPSSFVYSWNTRCCDPPSGPTGCYNTSVYNNQALSYGAHTLNIQMFSYLGPNSYPGTTYCDFVFDYAVISTPTSTSAIPSLWTSSTAIPSSTAHPSPSNQQSKYVSLLLCGGKLLTSCSKKLPAAIGGALGGVAAVMAVILAVLCFRKSGYRHQRTHSEVDPEPIQSTFRPAAFVTYPSLNRDTPHDWSPSSLLPENTNLEGTDISPYAMSLKATTSLVPTNLLPEDIDLAPDNPSPSPIPSKPGLPFADPTSSTAPSQHSSSLPPQPVEVEANVRARVTPSAVIPAANSSKMSTCLTEEQTDLVQGLIKQNVPLTTVASVMEGWLKSERPSGDGEGSGGHSGVGSENPPDYDFPVTAR